MNPKSKEGEASGVPLIGSGFHGDPTTRGKNVSNLGAKVWQGNEELYFSK